MGQKQVLELDEIMGAMRPDASSQVAESLPPVGPPSNEGSNQPHRGAGKTWKGYEGLVSSP